MKSINLFLRKGTSVQAGCPLTSFLFFSTQLFRMSWWKKRKKKWRALPPALRNQLSLSSSTINNHQLNQIKKVWFVWLVWLIDEMLIEEERAVAAPWVAWIGWFWLNGMARWTPAPFHQTNQLNSLHKSITSNSILNLFHGVEWNKWNWMVSFMNNEAKRWNEWGELGWKPITVYSVIKR